MSARPAPVTVHQALAPVEGAVDVTAGWLTLADGSRGMVLVGTFDTVNAAVKWVRSNPGVLRGEERVEVRSDHDYLNPVARLRRGGRGWVVEK